MSLEAFIRQELSEKPILLMTHLVLGYPSLEENKKTLAAMVAAGVELIELQIPFSEPSADGPILVRANAQSLERGTKVEDCMEFAQELCREFPKTTFLFMTYYNILYKRGVSLFLEQAQAAGIKGLIIPDLPWEEAGEVIQGSKQRGLSNILIFTPTHQPNRLALLGAHSQGLVYCVGRRGVTGQKTDFSPALAAQIALYRQHTRLPLALGFGVAGKEDVDFLVGKADIAVIGTKLIQLHQEAGAQGVGAFLSELR